MIHNSLSISLSRRFYYFIILFGTFILVWLLVWLTAPNGKLKFYALDVGQGDAIFIETPRKNQILVDGGPNSKVLSELGEVMPFYDRTIDLIVLTHPQQDHIFGLVEVLKRYKVANVLITGVDYSGGAYEEFKKIISEKGINVFIAQSGQKVFLDKDTSLDVLYPFEKLFSEKFAGDVNDTSVAAVLSFGNKKFLLAGDAGLMEEAGLVNSGADIDIDVLKLNHHGSKYANSRLFLEKTSPEIAVVSSGKNNRYGHPHKETLGRLANIPLYRTDTQGRIAVLTDGKDLSVKTER
ncbi:MAG: ComEC/Rec2 family competence protein [Patescibacteria group bacterium]